MDINYIKNRVKDENSIPLIDKAFSFADEKLKGIYFSKKEPLINYVLGITNTLIDFNADSDTLVSSILFETIKNGVSKEKIEKEFGKDISDISSIAARINIDNNVGECNKTFLDKLNADSQEDVRGLFINLASSFYSIQSMNKRNSNYKKKVAREALDVLVPTAQRLRLNYIRSKLEDLCLSVLEPDVYNDILNKLNAPVDALMDDLNSMKRDISELLNENKINFIIKGRVKNIYSIYNKLASGKQWDEIFDVLALRIIVEEDSECSKVAEIIHSKYIYLPERFKDYINSPKENMYQSLHTTIIGNGNRFYEVQIRTNEMNKTAETGNASHQVYKEKTKVKL